MENNANLFSMNLINTNIHVSKQQNKDWFMYTIYFNVHSTNKVNSKGVSNRYKRTTQELKLPATDPCTWSYSSVEKIEV